MAGIFISYRQEDAKAWAIGLRNDLAKVFGKDKVFLDKEDLGPGSWHEQIQRALDRCNVVLVVIGPRWLTVVDGQNRPRLALPDDVHRQEIALALHHEGTTVIPVLFDDALMPRVEQLPDDIHGLAGQQAYKIGDMEARREADLGVLVNGIVAVSGLVAREPKRQPFPHLVDATAALFSFGFTVTLAMYYQNSNPLGMREIVVSAIFVYAMTILGKVFWRYFL